MSKVYNFSTAGESKHAIFDFWFPLRTLILLVLITNLRKELILFAILLRILERPVVNCRQSLSLLPAFVTKVSWQTWAMMPSQMRLPNVDILRRPFFTVLTWSCARLKPDIYWTIKRKWESQLCIREIGARFAWCLNKKANLPRKLE